MSYSYAVRYYGWLVLSEPSSFIFIDQILN